MHEGVRYLDGYVEVLERVVAVFAVDELADVGVGVAQLPHVRAEPERALRERRADGGVELHHRDGAAGVSVRGLDDVVARAQFRESESDSAAPLLYHGGVVGDLHDGFHVVVRRHHEAGGQAAAPRAGVDDCGRVGKEAERGQQAVEPVLPEALEGVVRLAVRDGARHAAEQLGGRLQRVAVGVPPEVALLQDVLGVVGQRKNAAALAVGRGERLGDLDDQVAVHAGVLKQSDYVVSAVGVADGGGGLRGHVFRSWL